MRTALGTSVRPVASLLGVTAGVWAAWTVLIFAVDAALGDLDARVYVLDAEAGLRRPAPTTC